MIDWNAERSKTVLNVAAIREVYSTLQVVGFTKDGTVINVKVKDPNSDGSTMYIARTALKNKEKLFSHLTQFNIYENQPGREPTAKVLNIQPGRALTPEEVQALNARDEITRQINDERRKELFSSPEFTAMNQRLISQLKVLEQGPLSKNQRRETARNCAQKEIRALLAKFGNKYRISFSESISLAEETLQTLKVEEVMLG
jgi:hypothetical protein